MKVKDIDGAGDEACRCESWLHHWDRFSGQEPDYCPVQDCMNQIETAAQVRKDDPTDGGWYVLPLCHKHAAMQGEALQVNDNVKLVTANLRGTCG